MSSAKARNAAPKSKTAFVLALPATMTAKDVVAKGKAAGVKLSTAYVYVIRANAKRGSSKKTASRESAQSVMPSRRSRSEEVLLGAAAVVGLSHALEVLRNERTRVHRMIAART